MTTNVYYLFRIPATIKYAKPHEYSETKAIGFELKSHFQVMSQA